MGAEGDLVALRLARGCRCFAAWLGTDVVAYAWLSTQSEWIGEIELEIRPPAGEAYIWNCVTLPAHRRQGFFLAVLLSITSRLKDEGLVRLWIGSVEHPAENAVGDAGFMPVLRFTAASPRRPRWLRGLAVSAADGADAGLVEAGRLVMANGARPLRLGYSVGRARSRRH